MKPCGATMLLAAILSLTYQSRDLFRVVPASEGAYSLSKVLSSAFVGTGNAWIVARYGRHLTRTTDGGDLWQTISGDQVKGFGMVSFTSQTQGWTVSSDNKVWTTLDGGLTWAPISQLDLLSDKPTISQLFFVDSVHGWVMSRGQLCRTLDGGRSWSRASTNAGGRQRDLIKFDFIDASNGWLASENGIVLKTVNGGRDWIPKYIGSRIEVCDLSFVDEKNGWALAGGIIYHTSDGGDTWREQLRPSALHENSEIWSLAFLNRFNGWAIGHRVSQNNPGEESVRTSFVVRSDDGGVSWNRAFQDATDSVLLTINFTDANNGWLVSEEGLLRTIDGGRVWRRVLNNFDPIPAR